MKAHNIQLATAAVGLALIVLVVTLVRGSYNKSPEPPPDPAMQIQPQKPPPQIGSVSGSGYDPNVSLDDAFMGANIEEEEDDDYSQEKCQKFTTHLRQLKSAENPSAAAQYSSSEAVAGFGEMCKTRDVPMAFIKCALTKDSADDLIKCETDD